MEHQQTLRWTPSDRDEWLAHCANTDKERGVKDGYGFNVMMKQLPTNGSDQEDPRRSFVTSCLANTLYGNHPLIKRLSLCFYKALMMQLSQNSFLTLMQRRGNFVIMVKGSNAYKLLLRRIPQIKIDVDYSDLDVVVFINPHLEDALFEQIKGSLVILISQVLSKYKKDLDATLFASGDNVNLEERILRKDLVQDFKELFKSSLEKYEEEGIRLLTPFQSNKVRNYCSKRSFVIIANEVQRNHVVRVEVPHLPRCERIPLKKTPIVLSHNKTIEFDRDIEGKYKAHFELLRLRINNMLVPLVNENQELDKAEAAAADNASVSNGSSDGCSETDSSLEFYDYKKCKVVPADFIDVSIPCKDDAELLDFWNSGGYKRCYEIFDKFVGANIMIPNVNECIRDLSNILNVYTNSQMKVEKRQKRLDMFKLLDENRKKIWDTARTDTDGIEH